MRPKQLCTFTRQLSTLQDAGLPILRSLRILEGQSKPGPLKNSLIGVIEDIESGSTLSEAMAKQPKAFDNLYVNMVKAGEAGGALEIILQRLAEFKERSQSLKRKVQGAMIYPVAVITVATGIVGFIMYWIIPKFKKIFADFGIELPAITIWLIFDFSDLVCRLLVSDPGHPGRLLADGQDHPQEQDGRVHPATRSCSRFPFMGKIVEKSVVARTARTLGTLISSGVPILGSVDHRPRYGRQRGLSPGVRQYLRGHSRRRIDGGPLEGGPRSSTTWSSTWSTSAKKPVHSTPCSTRSPTSTTRKCPSSSKG